MHASAVGIVGLQRLLRDQELVVMDVVVVGVGREMVASQEVLQSVAVSYPRSLSILNMTPFGDSVVVQVDTMIVVDFDREMVGCFEIDLAEKNFVLQSEYPNQNWPNLRH